MILTVKAVAVVSSIVVAVILTVVVWHWVDRHQTDRALTAHMEKGKAYPARMLEELGPLPDELRESSGLAVSRTQPGVLWSHNDSGDGPNLYAINSSGRLLAVVPVTNADAQDWEDMASGPCPAGLSTPKSPYCLYVADTGDNDEVREVLTVYVMVEPSLGSADTTPLIAAAHSFRYRYPDAPHDSEAFAVNLDGDVTIVSKGRSGTIDFFGISGTSVARALTSGEVLTAEHQGNTGIEPDERLGRYVTGAALSFDGMTFALRTYNEVFFYGAVEAGHQGSPWRDLGRPCFLGDAEPQGEAIAYFDEKSWLLTSERARGRPGIIHRLWC
jgi:hypothetical protein